MNIVSVLCLSVCFILMGAERIMHIKRKTLALYEAKRFINLVKNNIRFSSMDYEGIIECGKRESFSFIDFREGITLSSYAGEKEQACFSEFSEKIGTTDSEGQLSLCEEFYEYFKGFYNDSSEKEKGKVNIAGALSFLSVVCVFVLGG